MRNNIMTTATDSWTRNWTIVSADVDLAHVMLPLSSFRLENVSPAGQSPVYRVVHNDQPPAPDCFAESYLVPVGNHRPTFLEITQRQDLPFYATDTEDQYVEVADLMAKYMTQNTGVQRLEGVIKVPCQAGGAPVSQGAMPSHSHLAVETKVHLYRFDNVVKGDLPLLVVRAPLSPDGPTNGDGTAVGYGRN
jgi:hypothetical protein